MLIAMAMTAAWAAVVIGALVVLGRGLLAGVYFEPTGEAIAEAHRGRVLVATGCCLLLLAAAHALLVAHWPDWVGVAVLTPAIVCGGLTLFAPQTLFPFLTAYIAYPTALVGVMGGVLVGRGSAA
jgi:hypothetical protein